MTIVKHRGLLLAAAVLAGAFILLGSGATVAMADTVITACAKKQNGQLRLVSSGDECRPSETVVQWIAAAPAGPGVKTISGLVASNGATQVGSGFTSTRNGAGNYTIHFPPGTWASFPVMVVSPFGLPGAFPVCEIFSALGFVDGSADYNVICSSTAGPWTPLDVSFWFITTAS